MSTTSSSNLGASGSNFGASPSDGEEPLPRASTGSTVRSQIMSILPDDFKELITTEGRNTVASISENPKERPPRTRRSVFDFGLKSTPSNAESGEDSGSLAVSQTGSKSNWRMRLTSDLGTEAASEASFRGKTSSIEGKDVSKRLEKLKERKEETKNNRITKNFEMKSLMEQVASIAAQSRGIMRAQPKQSDQQRLMGEIITLMGKMAEKMSKLMLATEPPDDDDEQNRIKEAGVLSEEEAEAKAEQILLLLSKGEDSFELEWKRMEIKTILMSDTEASRKRTNDKQAALNGLALERSDAHSGSTNVSTRSRRSVLSRDESRRSSSKKSSKTKRRSKSTGDRSEKSSKKESSRKTEKSWSELGSDYAVLGSAMDT